jgi:glycosyltransferase involved in cell wall biosynthesis
VRILTAASRLAGIGGLERAQLEACRQLHERGHRIDLLYEERGDLYREWAEIAKSGIRVDGYALRRDALLRSAKSVASVAVAVRRMAPDLVYVHHQHDTPSAVLGGKPVVCHLHLPPPPRRSAQEDLGLRGARRLIAVSQFTARQWSESLQIPPERFAIVHNGVDLARFAPLDESRRHLVRRALGLPIDRFLVVYTGRIDPDKGVDRALQTARLLDPGHYHLAIAGEPNPGSFRGDADAARSYADDLRARFHDAPVTWLGRLEDVSALVASSDAAILPSRFDEPFGLAVLETLASGIPIVASAAGGIPEIMSGELAANLVASGEPDAYVHRFRALRDWRTTDPELGQRGREHVASSFTLSRMGDELNETLERVVEERGRPDV